MPSAEIHLGKSIINGSKTSKRDFCSFKGTTNYQWLDLIVSFSFWFFFIDRKPIKNINNSIFLYFFEDILNHLQWIVWIFEIWYALTEKYWKYFTLISINHSFKIISKTYTSVSCPDIWLETSWKLIFTLKSFEAVSQLILACRLGILLASVFWGRGW